MADEREDIETQISSMFGRFKRVKDGEDMNMVKDVSAHHIPTSEARPPAVSKFNEQFYTVQQQTARNCIRVAEWLENQAKDLRERAASIDLQSREIPDAIAKSVSFEREAADKVTFLSSLWKVES